MIKVINDQIFIEGDDTIIILSDRLKITKRFNKMENVRDVTGNDKYIAGVCDGLSTDDVGIAFFCPTNGNSKSLRKLRAPNKAVINSVAVSGDLLAIASSNKYVYVRNMSTNEELYRLNHETAVNFVTFHKDLIISTSDDESTRIWCSRTGEQLHSMKSQNISWRFDISPDGTLIALPHNCGVAIWSLANYEKIAEVNLADLDEVYFLTNEKMVAVSSSGRVSLITSTVQ